MLSRRSLLAAGAGALAAGAARAQAPARIAYLSGRSEATDAHLLAAFRDGLREAGIAERAVALDVRWAAGDYAALPALARDLVAGRPDLLVGVGGTIVAPALRSALAGGTTPIVFVTGGDPVELGLVQSLARPGGTITGATLWASALEAKRIELLHALHPGARRAALLINPEMPGIDQQRRAAEAAAAAAGLALTVVAARDAAQIDDVFAALARAPVDALAVAIDAFLLGQRARIVAGAAGLRLPGIFPSREFVDAGGLASYGARWTDIYRIAGDQAGRILKGARAADIPVQRPTGYELVLNLATARRLDLAIDPSLLARADAVIE